MEDAARVLIRRMGKSKHWVFFGAGNMRVLTEASSFLLLHASPGVGGGGEERKSAKVQKCFHSSGLILFYYIYTRIRGTP